MKYYEKTIHSENIFQGKIINVKVDDVLLVNGERSKREIVQHSGAVAVLPINDNNKIFLVRQFRKPIENELIELPAGKLEKDEEPEQCALRELEEEIGYKARKIKKITCIYTSPGFADEAIHIFVASQLIRTKINRDEDEFMDVLELDIEDAVKMINEGKIVDAKTIVGILTYIQQNNQFL